MSLDLVWKDCAPDKQKAPDSEKFAIGSLLMLLGVDSITDKTLPEIAVRYALYHDATGGFFSQGGDYLDYKASMSLILLWSGLRSNVSRDSRVSFVKRAILNPAERRAKRTLAELITPASKGE